MKIPGGQQIELNRKYTEILKLYKMLNEAKTPCEVEFTGSYGCIIDTLEIMGPLTFEELEIDSVSGFLTAEDVFNRWESHYEQEV